MDRWRLPVVYGKMLKSQFVSNRDAAIWRTVSKNLEDKDVMGVFKRALEPRRAQSAMRTRRPLRGVSGPLKVAPLCINPSPCTRKCVLNPLYTMCIKPSPSPVRHAHTQTSQGGQWAAEGGPWDVNACTEDSAWDSGGGKSGQNDKNVDKMNKNLGILQNPADALITVPTPYPRYLTPTPSLSPTPSLAAPCLAPPPLAALP
eukprot:CAMPEP_0173330792 /NCGR_PEP_ID=MMETSP1144-20121109/3436_1 /TAXON_ID=483371 /ORGANISM="non described non described, Strain CCMP2298" /LENGTH=201 /DNA_ID=CAMNT_0014275489 /DNA_START=1 /DNA_END=604 /DNA_ORIENTATION=+